MRGDVSGRNVSADEKVSSPDDRRAALAAAAGALRNWVQTQRTTGGAANLNDTGAEAPSVVSVPADPPPGPRLVPPPQQSARHVEATAPRRAHSTSILSLDDAAESVEAPVEAPGPTWWDRAVTIYQFLKRVLGPLKAPARRLAPHALKYSLIAAAVGALVAGVYYSGRWAYREYWPEVTAMWANFTAPTGFAVLESEPPGSQVYVDGRVVGTTPMRAELPPGQHVVEFRRGESIRSLEIDVVEDQSTTARLDWTAARTGILRADSTPQGATVIVDGRERGVTPLTLNDLVVGSHEVILRSDAGSVRRTVTIGIDQPVEVSEAIYSGFMHVSTPIEIAIVQGGRNLTLDDQNQVLMPSGSHRIQFENRRLGYLETRQVQINPGETTRVVIAPSPSRLTVSSALHAEVLIDGERVGETPLTNFPIRLGTREIVVRTAAGQERRYTLTVSATPVQLDVDFAAP